MVKFDDPRFDGVPIESAQLLLFIDSHIARFKKVPTYKQIRARFAAPEYTEASVWAYLFHLKQTGAITVRVTNRGIEIGERLCPEN